MKNILIRNCPWCGKEHIYSSEIKRVQLGGYSLFGKKGKEPVLPKNYTRVFTCLTTGKDFKAKITQE